MSMIFIYHVVVECIFMTRLTHAVTLS